MSVVSLSRCVVRWVLLWSSLCSSWAPRFVSAQDRVVQTCNVCGENGVIGNPFGSIQVPEFQGTCIRLATEEFSLQPNFCLFLQTSSLIAEECGCTNPDQTCPPCGNGVLTNPFGTSPFPELTATCALLQQNQRLIGPGSGLPDNFCEIFQNQPEAQERCGCEFPPTPPPVATPAPVAAPTMPAPTDDSEDVVPLGPFARFFAIIIDIFRLFFNNPSPMP